MPGEPRPIIEPIRRYRIDLTVAESLREYTSPGRYFRVIQTSDPDAVIYAGFDARDVTRTAFTNGMGIAWRGDNPGFASFYLAWDAQPGKWMEIVTSSHPDIDVEIPAAASAVTVTGGSVAVSSLPSPINVNNVNQIIGDVPCSQPSPSLNPWICASRYPHLSNAHNLWRPSDFIDEDSSAYVSIYVPGSTPADVILDFDFVVTSSVIDSQVSGNAYCVAEILDLAGDVQIGQAGSDLARGDESKHRDFWAGMIIDAGLTIRLRNMLGSSNARLILNGYYI